jgi:uncharacterized Fe-S center protein
MGPSEVFFTDMHSTPSLNLLKKLGRLVRAAGFDDIDFDRKMTALKVHFGEPGNLAYLRPNFAAMIATHFITACDRADQITSRQHSPTDITP